MPAFWNKRIENSTNQNTQAPPTPIWKYIAAVVAMVILVIVIELAMGRVPWYQHGPVTLWTSSVLSDQSSQQFLDPYTLTHIEEGIFLYWIIQFFATTISLGWQGVLALFVESLWEIAENSNFIIQRYRTTTISMNYYGDSVLNSMGDILACGVGFFLASRLPTWVMVTTVIVIELILAFWVHDNFTISAVMLIHPIPAIKAWQLGI